jgi:hypothetical protein
VILTAALLLAIHLLIVLREAIARGERRFEHTDSKSVGQTFLSTLVLVNHFDLA